MPRTKEERDAFDMQAMGCLGKDLIEANPTFGLDPMMLAMSILSDAQEEAERGNKETVRQFINRAKFVIQLQMGHGLGEEIKKEYGL